MSKLVKFFAIAVLIAGTVAMTSGPAAARWGHGWHGGGRGWGGGAYWGWAGYPYAGPYYGGPYYAGPGCGYVRVWRGGRWVLRRPYRCY